MKIFWHLELFISNQFILKLFVYYVRHLGPELNRLRISVVVWSDRTLSRSPTGAQKRMTGWPKYDHVPGHDRQNAPLIEPPAANRQIL